MLSRNQNRRSSYFHSASKVDRSAKPTIDHLSIFPGQTTIGIGADLVVTKASGQALSFPSIPDGSLLPLRISRVHATGTTAQSTLGLT
ncbi:spike base protein, RCAP_Rcc01079 family [Rhizobium tibeticum]|uniref:spike base protein, RCAP_Rcc01079 family n=1 Tax=Rhizobium tibeticum TaxID=501024 RepID=UPI000931C107